MDLALFFPSHLFDLRQFSHKKLFDLKKPAWNALSLLEGYLQTFEGPLLEKGSLYALKNNERIFVGKETVIDPFVLIEGPVIIGNRCHIKHGAYIRSGTIIGDDCIIGHATEVSRSIILSGAKLPHFNYVGDSIIGNQVNLGAGSKCANFRLDGNEIFVSYKQERISTGRNKLGALIGDHSSIGCNTVLNPGSILLQKTTVGPCREVRGVVGF